MKIIKKIVLYTSIMILSSIIGLGIGLYQYKKDNPVPSVARGYYLTQVIDKRNKTEYNHWIQITGNSMITFNTMVQLDNQNSTDISPIDTRIQKEKLSIPIRNVLLKKNAIVIINKQYKKLYYQRRTIPLTNHDLINVCRNIKIDNSQAKNMITNNRSNQASK